MNITHPGKVLFPQENITKQDLANFYESVSDYILPYILKRPLVLFRCIKNYKQGCFFNKHLEIQSKALHVIQIQEKNFKKPYVYIQDTEGLRELVQQNTIEIHSWGCHVDNVNKPDRMVFDLDPSPETVWVDVIKAALLIKHELEKIELKSFVKTSGGKGLHIVVPLEPSLSWEDVKIFSSAFAAFIETKNPGQYITTMNKAKRKGKIFIDYFRNTYGATTVAAYSVRAREHAPVSTPLSWKELSPRRQASYYTLKNLPRRLTRLKQDPWEGFYELQQKVPMLS
jgi:bifunctional non-homologous end joining protein LigD